MYVYVCDVCVYTHAETALNVRATLKHPSWHRAVHLVVRAEDRAARRVPLLSKTGIGFQALGVGLGFTVDAV